MTRYTKLFAALTFCLVGLPLGHAEDIVKQFTKAVERSTLDQPGTKPFHLEATITPSRERDNGSHRTGSVKIWWQSPTQWRQEVTSPEFHQTAIVDGSREGQKNDGDYFPEWLREISVAILKPVPSLHHVLEEVGGRADVDGSGSCFLGHYRKRWSCEQKNWYRDCAEYGDRPSPLRRGDVGWNFLYADYKGFHNRDIARKVSGGGTPEATAVIDAIENLPASPHIFSMRYKGGDSA